MSNRKNDARGEKALGLFLDKYFYPQLCEIEGFVGTERIYDMEAQKAGADLLISNASGATIKVDEKAQLHYINTPRPTFAFEVSFYSENAMGIADGWFVSETNKTDCYMLVWIDNARTNQVNRLVEEDFQQVTVLFVTKQKIIQYLSKLGYSIDKIKKIAYELRKGGEENIYKLSPEAVVYYTNEGYDEMPINVVIDKSILCQMAYGVYIVSREDCTKLSKQKG